MYSLGQHLSLGSGLMKYQIRERQLKLLSSCHQLLLEIKELGGDAHETIKVFHLSIFEFRI